MPHTPVPDRLGLGVQQPWVELILRGTKTVEIRSQSTRVRGPIYLYASQRVSALAAAAEAARTHALDPATLPRGLLVGTVEIVAARPATPADAHAACLPELPQRGRFAWELRHPRRFARPLPIALRPYGIWFYPFRNLTEQDQDAGSRTGARRRPEQDDASYS